MPAAADGPDTGIEVRRLLPDEATLAAEVSQLMARTFEEGQGATADRMARLLADGRFWFFGAFEGGRPLGGLSAHLLPLTREDASELFIYDIAVDPDRQRRGIGRALMAVALQAAAEAGVAVGFVPADNADTHALAFYRALGGGAQAVTIFDFATAADTR